MTGDAFCCIGSYKRAGRPEDNQSVQSKYNRPSLGRWKVLYRGFSSLSSGPSFGSIVRELGCFVSAAQNTVTFLDGNTDAWGLHTEKTQRDHCGKGLGR